MRAVVLHEYGGPGKLKLEDVADPKPGPGQILVQTAATSVNPIDWKLRSGDMKQIFPLQFPFIPGRDLAGTVLELGSGVDTFAIGDRVLAVAQSTYAEKVVVAATDVAHIPESLGIVDAAAVPLVALTGNQLALATEPKKDITVLITGAVGSVGRFAVYTAQQLGARVIAGVREKQRKDAEALGVDQVVALDSKDAIDSLPKLDAIADAVGGDTAEQLLSHLRPDGIFATVVAPPSNAKDFPGIQIKSVMSKPDAKALAELSEAVGSGKVKLPIDRVMPLDQAAEAQTAAEKGAAGKIILSV